MDQCVSVARASGQMGMPTWSRDVLGEDQVQLRPAGPEQPTRQPEEHVSEAAGKPGLGLQGEALAAADRDLEVGWYLKA